MSYPQPLDLFPSLSAFLAQARSAALAKDSCTLKFAHHRPGSTMTLVCTKGRKRYDRIGIGDLWREEEDWCNFTITANRYRTSEAKDSGPSERDILYQVCPESYQILHHHVDASSKPLTVSRRVRTPPLWSLGQSREKNGRFAPGSSRGGNRDGSSSSNSWSDQNSSSESDLSDFADSASDEFSADIFTSARTTHPVFEAQEIPLPSFVLPAPEAQQPLFPLPLPRCGVPYLPKRLIPTARPRSNLFETDEYIQWGQKLARPGSSSSGPTSQSKENTIPRAWIDRPVFNYFIPSIDPQPLVIGQTDILVPTKRGPGRPPKKRPLAPIETLTARNLLATKSSIPQSSRRTPLRLGRRLDYSPASISTMSTRGHRNRFFDSNPDMSTPASTTSGSTGRWSELETPDTSIEYQRSSRGLELREHDWVDTRQNERVKAADIDHNHQGSGISYLGFKSSFQMSDSNTGANSSRLQSTPTDYYRRNATLPFSLDHGLARGSVDPPKSFTNHATRCDIENIVAGVGMVKRLTVQRMEAEEEEKESV